jgi:hypothetical protein
MANSAPARLGVKAALFEPGERLGWIFRDRFRYWRAFGEEAPHERADAPWHEARLEGLRQMRLRALLVGAAVTAVCFLLYLVALLMYRLVVVNVGAIPDSHGTRIVVIAWIVTTLPALVAMVGIPLAITLRIERLLRARGAAQDQHHERQRQHYRREQQRVENLVEWGAAAPEARTHRIDIFGGNLFSWEAFLTTFGASMVRESPPVTVIDLSEELVSDELYQLAKGAGFPVDRQVLPGELETTDLFAGMSVDQVVDVLIESFYGDAQDANRAERTMDRRILHSLCQELAPNLSMQRLCEGLGAMMGEPGAPQALTAEEWDRVATGLFSGSYVQQAHERLRRLEAYIHPLVGLGSRVAERSADARLRCLSVVNDGPNPFGDLLVDLIVQWTMRQIAGNSPDGANVVIVVGADHLQGRHLEKLSDLCERRHVRLVYLFRHLRAQGLQLLGGGAVGFMRLGNHEEAERAANFIGREHKFVVSSLCHSLNGGTTHSTGTNQSESDNSGDNRDARFLVWNPISGYTRSRSRNWGQSHQYTHQSGWGQQTTEQRVYEHRVEARSLQDLPDYALLFVESTKDGPRLRAIECNPDILSLPRATTQVLPEGEAGNGLVDVETSADAAPARPTR